MRAHEIIRAVLDMIDNISPSEQPSDEPIGYTDDDLPRIKQIAGLVDQDSDMSVLANKANPQYAGLDAVIASGDDVNKSKHPSDIRTNAPSMYPNMQYNQEQ
ncbi:hypothetical protein EB118_09950 [bacterium]|nr:hypothetical protein [bacterium]